MKAESEVGWKREDVRSKMYDVRSKMSDVETLKGSNNTG